MSRVARLPKFGVLLLIVVLGMLVGTVVGEVVALVLPAGVVREFFLAAAEARLGPATLDLHVLSVTLGVNLKVNVAGILGLLIAASALRWYSRSLYV